MAAQSSKRIPASSRVKPTPLDQFLKDRKRAKCAVCRLPQDIRDQIRAARERGVGRADVLVWLTEECKFALTNNDFSGHVNGRHDA